MLQTPNASTNSSFSSKFDCSNFSISNHQLHTNPRFARCKLQVVIVKTNDVAHLRKCRSSLITWGSSQDGRFSG